jgi:AcrR family transcriptional regulator
MTTVSATVSELSPRRQRRRARTAESLRAAARLVFERQGYAGTALQNIVDEADVTHRTFYTYFGSKDAVFGELLDALVDDFLSISTGSPLVGNQAGAAWGGSLRTRFQLAIEAILNVAEANRALLVAVNQAVHTNADHASRWSGLRARFEETAKRDIDWYVRSGIMAPPRDTRVLVTMMSATIESAILDLVADGMFDQSSVRDGLVDMYWNVLLRPGECADDYIITPDGTPKPVFVAKKARRAAGTRAIRAEAELGKGG